MFVTLKIPIGRTVEGIRLTIKQLYAAESTDLYGFYVS